MSAMIRRFTSLVLVSFAAATVAAGDARTVAHPLGASFETGGDPSFDVVQPLREPQADDPVLLATEHILSQQCDNGGFGWPHADCSTTYHNITGPILLGVLTSNFQNPDPYYLLGAVNGGAYSLTSEYANGEPRFGTFTPIFLMTLAGASNNTTFSNFVSSKLFDELAAGTYGPDDRDTAGWIAEIQAYRTGTWVNLLPWEFHTLIPAARELGQPGQDLLFEQAVLDGLETLDNGDPANVYSDIIGLAGGVRGLAFAERLTFPAIAAPLHPGVDGIDTLEELTAYLASLQNPDGSWYWHSNLSSPGDGDKDAQTTAYAVLALLEADRLTTADYKPAYQAGRDWLLSLVGPDGCIPSYPGGDPDTEVEGEVLTAIVAASPLMFSDGFETANTARWTDVQP